LHSLQVSWDSYGFPDYKIEQLSTEKIRKFVKELNETGRFNTNEADLVILKKLSLIKEEKPTIASVLLFAKEPERYHIRIGRFKSESSILDDRQITDTLFEASEESLKFVKNYIQIAYGFEGNLKRTERWEYPVEAIKESLLNAIVHRDYKNTNDIQIKIFDDRISIFSPGKLYGNLLIEDLKDNNYQSNLRNKLIAEAFYLTGKIEKYGTGFIRIREALKDYPTISFNFEEFSDGFLITYTKKSDKDVTKGVTKGVTKDVTKDDISLRFNHIIDLIKKDNTITIDEIAKSLEINRRTIIRYINKLKADKRIGREEGRKSGYWKVYE
jgi:ATP-dependent DNA helicase RecG